MHKNLKKVFNKKLIYLIIKLNIKFIIILYYIKPLTSPGEMVSVFASPYLSAGAPALGEAKGLIILRVIFFFNYYL